MEPENEEGLILALLEIARGNRSPACTSSGGRDAIIPERLQFSHGQERRTYCDRTRQLATLWTAAGSFVSPREMPSEDYSAQDRSTCNVTNLRSRAKIEIEKQESSTRGINLKKPRNYWIKDERGCAIFSVTVMKSIAIHGQVKVWQSLEKLNDAVSGKKKKREADGSCEPLRRDPPGGKKLAASRGPQKGDRVAVKVNERQVVWSSPPKAALLGGGMAKAAAVGGAAISRIHAPLAAAAVGGRDTGFIGAPLENRGAVEDAVVGSTIHTAFPAAGLDCTSVVAPFEGCGTMQAPIVGGSSSRSFDAPCPAVVAGTTSIGDDLYDRDTFEAPDVGSRGRGANACPVAVGDGGADLRSAFAGVAPSGDTMGPVPAEADATDPRGICRQDDALATGKNRAVSPTMAMVVGSSPRTDTTATNDITNRLLHQKAGSVVKNLSDVSHSVPQKLFSVPSSSGPAGRPAFGGSNGPTTSWRMDPAVSSLPPPVVSGCKVTPRTKAGFVGLSFSKLSSGAPASAKDFAGVGVWPASGAMAAGIAAVAGNNLHRTVTTPTNGIVAKLLDATAGPFGLSLSQTSFGPSFGKDATNDTCAPASEKTSVDFNALATTTIEYAEGPPSRTDTPMDIIVTEREAKVRLVQRGMPDLTHASAARTKAAGLQPGPAPGAASSAPFVFLPASDDTDVVAKARSYSASYDRAATETVAQGNDPPPGDNDVAPGKHPQPNHDPSSTESGSLPLGALQATTTVAHLEQLFSSGLLHPSRLVSNALARMGRLDLLECATKTHRCPFDATTSAAAAGGGQLGIIWWLQAHGIPWDARMMAEAAGGGHMPILLAAKTRGCPWDKSTCAAAARMGHFHVLQWAREPLVYASPYFIWAITQGNPYDNLVRDGEPCRWNEEVCSEAAAGGHLSLLQWARANGCPWDSKTILNARLHGHVEIVQWAKAHGCEESA